MRIAIVAALFLLLRGQVFAQQFLIPPAFYAVQGAPFSAVVETVRAGPASENKTRTLSRELRDGAGRQRFEMPTVEEAAARGITAKVIIYDFAKERVIELNTLLRTASIRSMDRKTSAFTLKPLSVGEQGPCPVLPGETNALGTRFIAGLEACGHHLVQTFQKSSGPRTYVRDLWLSRSYRMPLAETSEDPKLGLITQEVVEFSQQEPDAALFEVPPGYTVKP